MNEPDQNPYAPGAASAPASAADVAPQGAIVPGDFTFGEVFNLAGEVFRKYWLMGSVGVLIFFVMSTSVSLVTTGIELGFALAMDSLGALSSIGTLIATPLNYILQIPISFGGTWLGYQAVRSLQREEELRVEHVFEGFKHFLPLFVISLIQTLIIVAVMLPGVLVAGALLYSMGGVDFLDAPDELFERPDLVAGPLLAVFLLSFLPAMYVSMRLYLAQLICVDRGRGAVDALKDSWTLTSTAAWKILGFMIVFGLILLASSPFWGLAVLLTCGMALFPIFFFMTAVTGALYTQLTNS